MLPELDETSRAAGVLTAAGTVVALGWKMLLRLRQDSRLDGAGQSQHDGYKAIIDELMQQIKHLEARAIAAEQRADALEAKIITLNQRISDEVNRRYMAETAHRKIESESGGLRAEIDALYSREKK